MNEIKFRGMDVMTGYWVYGSHVKTGMGLHYILPQNLIADTIPQFKVDKGTVGQFTSLKDKNDKEVYSGDIVFSEWQASWYVVEWDEIGAMFLFHEYNTGQKEDSGIDYYEFEELCGSFGFYVDGNIHEKEAA